MQGGPTSLSSAATTTCVKLAYVPVLIRSSLAAQSALEGLDVNIEREKKLVESFEAEHHHAREGSMGAKVALDDAVLQVRLALFAMLLLM